MNLQSSVTFKGTRHGLLVSVREDEDFHLVLNDMRSRIQEKASFFKGSACTVDLGWRELELDECARLEGLLEELGLPLQGIVSQSQSTRALAESRGIKVVIGRLALAEHQGRKAALASRRWARGPAADPENQAMLHRKTLRSGQSIDFEGNVVILGDVNPGAEVEAAGDVVVMGTIRGVVHAGVGGRRESVVLALRLEPTQLRIADRALGDARRKQAEGKGPEMARLKDGVIEIVPYGLKI